MTMPATRSDRQNPSARAFDPVVSLVHVGTDSRIYLLFTSRLNCLRDERVIVTSSVRNELRMSSGPKSRPLRRYTSLFAFRVVYLTPSSHYVPRYPSRDADVSFHSKHRGLSSTAEINQHVKAVRLEEVTTSRSEYK